LHNDVNLCISNLIEWGYTVNSPNQLNRDPMTFQEDWGPDFPLWSSFHS
jgi:hypothetical protein